jgi:hypothetical protein
LTSRISRAASAARASIRDSGPVMPADEMGQAAELAVDGREQALDIVLAAHIGLDGRGAAAGLGNIRHHCRSRRLVMRIIHRDAISAGGGKARRRSADAATGAGDENDPVGHETCFPGRRRRLRAAMTLKASTAAANAMAK